MSSTSLVTDGFICYTGQIIFVDAPSSLDTPSIVGVVEVRPKIRLVEPPAELPDKPLVTSAQELRPSVSGRVDPDAQPPVDPPITKTAQELKPKITDAKEED